MKKVFFNTQYMGVLFFLFFSNILKSQTDIPNSQGAIWYNAIGNNEVCLYYLYVDSMQNFLIVDQNIDTIVFNKLISNFVDEKPLSFRVAGDKVIVTQHNWKKRLFRKEKHLEVKYVFNHY